MSMDAGNWLRLRKSSILPCIAMNDAADRNLELSSRNLPGCALVRHHSVHAYDILSHDGLLISERALMRLQKALQ